MSGVVNLREARKRAKRAADKAEADANAVKYGLSKGEKRRIEADKAAHVRHLDRHRREFED